LKKNFKKEEPARGPSRAPFTQGKKKERTSQKELPVKGKGGRGGKKASQKTDTKRKEDETWSGNTRSMSGNQGKRAKKGGGMRVSCTESK